MMMQPLPKRGARPTMLLLMGVSGSGKTTTGQRLARKLGWVFRDADDFHPPANIEKMRAGVALTDEDRWPWLEAIGHWLDLQRLHGGRAVVTCSALRRAYRDKVLHGRSDVKLVYLKGSKALIGDRLSRRQHHFMPTSLLDSQFATLEEPARDERALVVSVSRAPNSVVDEIVRYVVPPHARLAKATIRPHR